MMRKIITAFCFLFSLILWAQVKDSMTRVIRMEGTTNFRDVGGYKTKNGKQVVMGKVFRSASLDKLIDHDMKIMDEKSIHTVIDFRGIKESERAPDRLNSNTEYILCSAGSNNIPDKADLKAKLRDGDTFLMSMYGEPGINYFGERYAPLFQKLLILPKEESLLYHCSGGRDRTGMATALLLYALDVPMKTIEADFTASNVYLKTMNKKLFASLAKIAEMSEKKMERKMTLKPKFIRTFFKDIKDKYGSVEAFMEKELGVGEEELNILKSRYTE